MILDFTMFNLQDLVCIRFHTFHTFARYMSLTQQSLQESLDNQLDPSSQQKAHLFLDLDQQQLVQQSMVQI